MGEDEQIIEKGSYIDFKKDDGNSFRYNVSVNGNKMRLGNEEDVYFELKKNKLLYLDFFLV